MSTAPSTAEADLMLSEELSIGLLVRLEEVIPSIDSTHVSTTRHSSTLGGRREHSV